MISLWMIGLLIWCCQSSVFCMEQKSEAQEVAIGVQADLEELQNCALCGNQVQPKNVCLECLRDCMGMGTITECYESDCIAVCHTACLKKYLKENRAVNRFKCTRCGKGCFIIEYGAFCNRDPKMRVLDTGLFLTLVTFAVNYTIVFLSSLSRWSDIPPCPSCNETMGNMVCQFTLDP